MGELLPCPFCGEPDIRIQGGDVCCSTCGPFPRIGVEQWNMRRAERFKPEERAAIQKALDALRDLERLGRKVGQDDPDNFDGAAKTLRSMLGARETE